jgi:RNA polymerase sigma-70 factor (ECF subfamily)
MKDALLAESGYLVAFASSRVGSLQDAEDLAQEAIVAAWCRRASFSGGSSLRTWVTGILRHKITDYYRSLRRTPTRLTWRIGDDAEGSDPLDTLFDAHGSWLFHPLAGSPSKVSAERTHADVIEAVRHCLEALPESWRRLFSLRILDGGDILDCASAAGVTVASASVILVRAKHRLRLCLMKEGFLR